MLRFLQYRLSPYRRMASPAEKTAEEREDTDYDPGTSGSEAGTPKKGRKKKETPDPGLTLGTDIEDHLKLDGRQVEVELDNVRITQEKTKGQIRRKDTKLLQKRIESLEAAPPTGPLHVVLWEDNSMLPTDCSLFSLREPLSKTCLIIADGDYWCVSGQHSVEAIAKTREKRHTACLDLPQWHTTCIADMLKPATPGPSVQSWRDKHKEAHKTLSQYRCMRQQITSFDVLKISGGKSWLTRTAISRSSLWMLCR